MAQLPPQAKAAPPAPNPAPAPAPARRLDTPAPAPVQRKAALPSSQPGDRVEREADAVATRVMRSAAPGPAPTGVEASTAGAAQGPMLSAEHQAGLGPGQPLPPDLRAELEPRFGASLERVRLLTDGAAANAASSIQARAFTLGHRIGFAAGEYQPTTTAGQWLLAHEIAHVLQQQDGTVPRQVMRACIGDCADAPAPPRRAEASRAADRHLMQAQNGTLLDEGPTLLFDSVEVPSFKLAAFNAFPGGTLRYTKNYSRGNPNQAQVWRTQINKTQIQARLQTLATQSTAGTPPAAGAPLAFEVPVSGRGGAASGAAATPGRRGPVYFGDIATLSEVLTIPNWGRGSRPPLRFFHVDHKVELQLARWERNYGDWANTLDNMELLQGRDNEASGCFICKSIEGKLARHIAAAAWPEGEEPTPRQLKRRHHIEFGRAVGSSRGGARAPGEHDRWARDEIESATHLEALERVNPAEIGASADGSTVMIFPRSTGGLGKRFPLEFGSWTEADKQWLKPFVISGKQFRTGGAEPGAGDYFGFFHVELPAGDPNFEGSPEPVRIARVPGAPFAGRIDKLSVLAGLRSLHFKGMSPIELDDVEIEEGRGLVSEGRILPTLPMFEQADIRFSLRNGEAMLYKSFTLDELTAPPPLRISEASLTLFLSSRRGLGAEGRIDFALAGAGNGYLAAEASTGGGFALAGGFDFDSRYFEPARISARYDLVSGQISASGDLGFKPNAIPGVRSGSLHAEFADGVFRANGQILPSVPGLEQVNLTAEHSEARGLILHGDATVGSLPGVRSGRIAIDLARPDAESPWDLQGEGQLEPAIPGINLNLQARYDNGVFVASADAPFQIGERVSGHLLVGVANVPCGSDGQPQEGATAGDTLLAFGQGTATVQISDQFQGDFGIRVASDASLRISGGVGISQPITLFDARSWNRELLRFPTVSIPIFGIAVGGNVVGIAATIGGGVNAEASVGPGQIDEGRIAIEDFDPAQPDSLRVTGRVRFVVPAQAGLNGHLDAGISAGLAVIRATGGISIQLGLGVNAGASSELDLDWTAAQGLVLAATLSASATPRLRASINGFAEVVADAFVTSFTLWRRDYVIAEREFGSGLTVGISVPATWRQYGGLDFDFDRVQFQVPELSPEGALAGLLREEGSETERNDAPAN